MSNPQSTFQNSFNREVQQSIKELESIVRTIRKEQRMLEEHLGLVLTTEKTYKKKEHSNGD